MNNQFSWRLFSLGVLPIVFQSAHAAEDSRPNIMIIMADDMGISDLGCYGSEIRTPNLDALAQSGIRYSNFYNGARSCPTRASLMTGLYAHQAGMGWMEVAYEGDGSYQGDLSKNALTIAEYLKLGAYKTYLSGKWHLSLYRKNNENIQDNWPVQRGFDQFFGIVGGAASYFTPTVYSNNRSYKAPAGFYMTDAISDTAVTYIRQQKAGEPFFMYVAYTAPHWPLHARPEDITKYDGVYQIGWDSLRVARFQKQKAIGFADEHFTLSPRDPEVNAWSKAIYQADFSKRMQIYAAQIEVMDQGIGRIVEELRQKQLLDNTLIFFLSDNGACQEFQSGGVSKELTGAADTYESYRRPWANASNTPYRMFKHFVHEGGIKTPLIVHWPAGITKTPGTWERSVGHVMDIFKTIEDIVQIPYPDTYHGNVITPLQGQSLLPNFTGTPTERAPLFWEHESNIAVRWGDWKLVTRASTDSVPPGMLELYNLKDDPTELNNLAASNPAKTQELWAAWQAWANEKKVYPLSRDNFDERQVLDERYPNGEFDTGMAGWVFSTAGTGVGNVSLDATSQLSGPNSARINVVTTGAKPNNIVLGWPFPLKQGERCKVHFKGKADRAVTFLLRLEENNDDFTKVIDVPVNLDQETRVFEFDSQTIPLDDTYKIGFYFGSSVPCMAWIDDVELSFINESALSPSWSFMSVAGAAYTLSFNAKSTQLFVPLTVTLRRPNQIQDVLFSRTVDLTRDMQAFSLKIPAFMQDEELFLEFVYPPYASQACSISQVNLNVQGTPVGKIASSPLAYTILRTPQGGYKVTANQPDATLRVEMFHLNGEKVKEISGRSQVVISEINKGLYLLRISENNRYAGIEKIYF